VTVRGPASTEISAAAEATEDLGSRLAATLRCGDIVLLEGDLAAGKTTFVRGLVRGLGGAPQDVSSPSFVLIQSYPCHGAGIDVLHHVDLYRLADSLPDLRELGLDEVLSDPRAVVAVEWPKDTLATWIPNDSRVVRIGLRILEDDRREIEVTWNKP
jgi:tRNA threonylcarbamoyladenosine biosynthesis protein TsaE